MHHDGNSSSTDKPWPSSDTPKRILYVDHTAKIGGGEIAILNLINAIDRKRFEPVFVLGSTGPLLERLTAAHVETYVIELDSSVTEARKDSLGFTSLFKLRQVILCCQYVIKLSRLIRSLQIDVVHTNSLKSHIFGGIAGRLAGTRVIWHVRDAIDSSYLPKNVVKVVKALARIVPTFVIANSASTLEKLDLNSSKGLSERKNGYASKTEKKRSKVVHDGCDPSFFAETEPEPSEYDDQRPFVVTLVGRITEWKGQHIFLRAAARVLKEVPTATFQIVGAPLFGEDEYEESLHGLCKELGIEEQVRFLGFRDDIPAIVSKCDLLVHASIIGEPFGQVVIEGMITGKPVIATDGGALPEIVINNVTGLLVEMGSVDHMADAIVSVYRNPSMARAMGKAGRERVLDNFTIAHTAAQMHNVYDELFCCQKN